MQVLGLGSDDEEVVELNVEVEAEKKRNVKVRVLVHWVAKVPREQHAMG
jgi:hypothetical protein